MKQKTALEQAEIAEILGAFIGDGWIEKWGAALYICGSPTEDKEYYDAFLAPLFSKHFFSVKPKMFPYWGGLWYWVLQKSHNKESHSAWV